MVQSQVPAQRQYSCIILCHTKSRKNMNFKQFMHNFDSDILLENWKNAIKN